MPIERRRNAGNKESPCTEAGAMFYSEWEAFRWRFHSW
jgi:hypothetical protein